MRFRLYVPLLLCAFFLFGCSSKSGNPSGKVHIKLVHFYVDQKDVWQKDVAEAYMKANPNVEVEVEAGAGVKMRRF